MDEVRLKLNPPTVHKGVTGVEGLKVYGFMVANVPAAMVLKLPVEEVTIAVLLAAVSLALKFITRVAVASEVVLKNACPAKSMSPVIGTACAPKVSAAIARTARIDFFIVCGVWNNYKA